MLGYSLYMFIRGNEVSWHAFLFSCCYLLGKLCTLVFASRPCAAADINAVQSRHPLISCSDSCHHTVSIRQQLKAGSCVCTYAFGSPVVQFTTGHSMIFARSSLSDFNQLLRPPSQTEERAVPAISNSAVPRFGCKA